MPVGVDKGHNIPNTPRRAGLVRFCTVCVYNIPIAAAALLRAQEDVTKLEDELASLVTTISLAAGDNEKLKKRLDQEATPVKRKLAAAEAEPGAKQEVRGVDADCRAARPRQEAPQRKERCRSAGLRTRIASLLPHQRSIERATDLLAHGLGLLAGQPIGECRQRLIGPGPS